MKNNKLRIQVFWHAHQYIILINEVPIRVCEKKEDINKMLSELHLPQHYILADEFLHFLPENSITLHMPGNSCMLFPNLLLEREV